MPKHIFLSPVLKLDSIHLCKLIEYAQQLPNVLFIISYQISDIINLSSTRDNIVIISPEIKMSRTEHWSFILEKINMYPCDTFSFIFYGDEIECHTFKDISIPDSDMIFSNSYIICRGSSQSIKRHIQIKKNARGNIYLLMHLGLATVAPLQRFIFKRECARLLSFSNENPYFSDQDAIISLLSHKNISIRYIDSPFYVFNLKSRRVENNMKLIDKLSLAKKFFKKHNCKTGFVLYTIMQLIKHVIR